MERSAFDSLEKLARVTHRGDARTEEAAKSLFDIILNDAKRHIPEEIQQQFDAVYNSGMQANLVNALQTIMSQLQENHGPCCVRFHVPKGK